MREFYPVWADRRVWPNLSVFALIFSVALILAVFPEPANAASAKIIRNSATGGDCTTIGAWDPATLTCTLNTDLVVTGKNGIEIVDNNITVDGNGHSITDSGGYTSGGAFSARTGITIKNLTIRQFNYGINILSSTGSTITGNTLENNTYGIYAIASVNGRIYNNNFINNTTQAFVLGGSGNLFSLPGSGGNFWNNFSTPAQGCSDNNGDFFCDAAFTFSGGQDSQPYTSQDGWNAVHPPDTTPPEILSVLPSGNIDSNSATVKVYYQDPGSNINLASVYVYLDGSAMTGCTITQESAACPVSGLALGAHTISGSVSDNRGNTSPISGAFNFSDLVSPIVYHIQPSGTVSSGSATVSALFSDGSGSGPDSSTAAVYLDGARVAGCTATSSGVSCPVSGLADGSHSLDVSVDDNAGNHGSGTGSFLVDKTAPVVSAVLPSGTVSTSSLTVSANYSDSGSGVSLASVNVYLDGALLAGCTKSPIGVSCPVSSLATGTHTIGGSVADIAGNSSPITGSFIFVDSTAPVVSGILPSGTINVSSTTVSANYSDGSGSGVDTATVAVYLDSARLSGCTVTSVGTSCPVSGLANGNHAIMVRASDQAGNQGSGAGSFTVDTSTPPISPTRYIRDNATGGDCTAIGAWDQYSKTCTLTMDLNFNRNGIEIADNGITLDGNGHTITGADAFTTGGSMSLKSGVTIRNLTIVNFGYGIYLLASSSNSISGNTLSGNKYGLYLSGSSGNSIFNNNFLGNTTQAYSSGGSGNSFNQAAPAGGNYWSDFDVPGEGCSNGNGDSFCDAAYAQYGFQDSLPWTVESGWATQEPVDPAQIGKPSLKLSAPVPFWGSYADYQARTLSVDWTIRNTGTIVGHSVSITGNDNNNGVSLLTQLPASAGDIAAGSSATLTFRYQVPAGIGSWRSTMTASAMDGAGSTYSYP
ncbi:MAG: right-handed parallel beta-helix repeat-containing protein [Actinobacteria bacterium]|nr:right-handed parallel beta-helix repeat-containing protein [Actinomycetota bacterium]